MKRLFPLAALLPALPLLASCGGSSDPKPNDFTEIAFSAADLKKDPGVEQNSARPAGVAAAQGKLFVALGNLTVDCMMPAGPGYLAVIDLTTDGGGSGAPYRLTELPSTCRNPQNVVANADGTRVFVSCSGQFGYGETPSEAVVAVDADTEQPVFTARLGCTALDSDACRPATPGKMAFLADGSLLVGDAGAGRIFHLDAATGEQDASIRKGLSICADHPQQGWQMTGDIAVKSDGRVVVTCFATSELMFLDDKFTVYSGIRIGSGAQLLALNGDQLLIGDSLDNAVYSMNVASGHSDLLSGGDRTGKAPNQIIVRGGMAYVIASQDNAVQVIDLSKDRPGTLGPERTVRQIPTVSSASPDATNTNPYLAAAEGDSLYVTLLGACTADGDEAGNRLVRIHIGDAEE